MANEKIFYNSSALFKVRDKKSEKAPDYSCEIQLDNATLDALVASGGKLRLAGWLREGKAGKFISLMASANTYVAKPKEESKSNGYQPQPIDEIDSDIPF